MLSGLYFVKLPEPAPFAMYTKPAAAAAMALGSWSSAPVRVLCAAIIKIPQ
jgi:hypothetical protein